MRGKGKLKKAVGERKAELESGCREKGGGFEAIDRALMLRYVLRSLHRRDGHWR